MQAIPAPLGIGRRVPGATAGSILFAGTDGVLAQDNANLKWGTTAGQGLTAKAGTAVSAVSAFELSQTWNYAAAAITGVKWTFTDTSSHANTLAFQILGGAAGATNLLSLGKDGRLGLGVLPSYKLDVSHAGEAIARLTNSLSASNGAWYHAIGSGAEFSTGVYAIAQGGPTRSNYEIQLIGSGILKARAGVSSPSFNSFITGRGDVGVLSWANSGGNFNGTCHVGQNWAFGSSATSNLNCWIGDGASAYVLKRHTDSTALLTVDSSGNAGFGVDVPVEKVSQGTANGARWGYGQSSELLTLSTSGTTTDTTANLLPANSIIESVTARITTTITTATDWQLGDATTPGRFTAVNAAIVAGTTDIGLAHIDQTGAAGPRQTAAAKVRVTTTGTPGAGAIRITVFYRTLVAPTS